MLHMFDYLGVRVGVASCELSANREAFMAIDDVVQASVGRSGCLRTMENEAVSVIAGAVKHKHVT